jgi:16S rRNA (cytidine1402-2'-O)-methyltransferase
VNELGSESGRLYLVATPIGNPKDLTLRALEILKSAALVAAEDTRVTGLLLHAHGIQARLLSYREQNHSAAARRILEVLGQGGDVALVSDAGTPGLSDPGSALVEVVLGAGGRVVPVPGPAAAIAALTASGLPCDRFLFVGFLPRKPGTLRKLLRGLAAEPGTLVFYESPRRAGETLAILAEVFGPRPAVLARELTKPHETFERGTLPELAERLRAGVLGEVTLLVGGAPEAQARGPADARALGPVVEALRSGRALGSAEIARLLAPLVGLDRRAVYALAAGSERETPEDPDDRA